VRNRRGEIFLALLTAAASIGWSGATARHVAWTAVDFFPPDFARQVRKHHTRYDAGVNRGLAAPPAWRAGPPGSLPQALDAQVRRCAADLRKPVPLEDLVEEIGVLAVLVLDANDPLAVVHDDAREPEYSGAYQSYVDSILDRVRLVYYGQDRRLLETGALDVTIEAALVRSGSLYHFIGEEFYRTGELRNWRALDDRSVTFGVAGVSLSRGLTDLANLVALVWRKGGGQVPTPLPTPLGHVGPTITKARLGGGFPELYAAELSENESMKPSFVLKVNDSTLDSLELFLRNLTWVAASVVFLRRVARVCKTVLKLPDNLFIS